MGATDTTDDGAGRGKGPENTGRAIEVRGARVHNLRGIDVDVPLDQWVAVAGVSGSGKSSLAMGVLYAEGSRRYLEALTTYTRWRMGQAACAEVDSVRHVPAALALRQRPGVPGVRSTFGTATELLNVLRLIFSRLGAHVCPKGHRLKPTLAVAAEEEIACPVCGAQVHAPGAEELAFNSAGACPTCEGTGTVREVDDAALIRDPDASIDAGTVIPWQTFGFNVQPQIAREFGVRTDVPWRELSDREREIVLDGPEEKKHIVVTTKKGVHDLDFTFRNARLTVTYELQRADSEKRLARVSRFLTERRCPDCAGTRLSQAARTPLVAGLNLAEATAMTLEDVDAWVAALPGKAPEPLRPMAAALAETFAHMTRRLLDLGLGYLTLDRAAASLSTGERQRVQLARAVRNETTGVLYVLDEPSIGLHPDNVRGLVGVIRDLIAEGNSVVMVDHDPQVLREADHVIEIGPGAGAAGGEVVAAGTPLSLADAAGSRIGAYLTGARRVAVREAADDVFARGAIELATGAVHTVHPLEVSVPRGRLSVVTGVSGSGKSTLVLDSLVPALEAQLDGSAPPEHVRRLAAEGIGRVNVVDATPIGVNVRSTVATYSGVFDEVRRAFARLPEARQAGLKAGDFSYNTGSLRCPRCEGTGRITLDVQFLPDVEIACPQCSGGRFAARAGEFTRASARGEGAVSLPKLMAMSVDEARGHLADMPKVSRRLDALAEVGLGYLTLGEATPGLSGGEAQRLKLAGELGKSQKRSLFIFDEPTVGLHPDDVAVLIGVLDRLLEKGATVLVIEHDLDMIANADFLVDMGPGGGASGGRIVACGTPRQLAARHGETGSVTGRYLAEHLGV